MDCPESKKRKIWPKTQRTQVPSHGSRKYILSPAGTNGVSWSRFKVVFESLWVARSSWQPRMRWVRELFHNDVVSCFVDTPNKIWATMNYTTYDNSLLRGCSE